MSVPNFTCPAQNDDFLPPSDRKQNTDFTNGHFLLHFIKKNTSTKVTYFSNFYYYTASQELRVRGASIARISEVCIIATMLLKTAGN
jgi:hypothetical protein